MRGWILLGGGAVGALWVLLKKFDILEKPKKLETTIRIGGTEAKPRVMNRLDELVAAPHDHLLWRIQYEFDGYTEVSLRNFKHKVFPDVQDPCRGRVEDRRNKRENGQDPKVIREVVRSNAFKGPYKYDVYLNGNPGLDPDIKIKEG